MTTKTIDSNHTKEHPAFSRIQKYIKGQLSTVEMQLCGHHIMHCHRCEAIWEQLIRRARQKLSKKSPVQRWLNFLI
ncbi:MAG: hypothetical protein OER04_18525 [Cyclobacteriaceae bacterium]|nr:hypothetical protein [Cyclobacteriaceae bacterium]